MHFLSNMFMNLVFVLIKVSLVWSCDDLIVKVNEGLLKGKCLETRNGKTIAGFTGIPFAEPPIGFLRFKAPVPKRPWNGVKKVLQPHNVCPNRDVLARKTVFEGVEDCLFLNVYTPKLKPKKCSDSDLLPIMFYIYGGGYVTGNANLYTPEILLDKGVILVTTNYRLGALGFLSTGDDVVPGNNGFKDQSLALKWTKDNAKTFCGDPNKITIFGESAGGGSVHLHVLSPLSRGLFSGAIVQSGAATSFWNFAPRAEAITTAKKLATFLNCTTENVKEMVDCLRTIDALDIVRASDKFAEWDIDPIVNFKPVAEINPNGAFMVQNPMDAIKSGNVANVPLMIGVVADEGILRTASFVKNQTLFNDFTNRFDEVAPITFWYSKLTKNTTTITNKLRKFYFNNEPITWDKNVRGVIDVYTDSFFFACTDESIRLHLKYTKIPIYYYTFGYKGKNSFSTIFGADDKDFGASHCDDLIYLFPLRDLFPQSNEPNDLKMTNVMTDLWTNFAKTGNPSGRKYNWIRIKSESLEYYAIKGPNDLSMKKNYRKENAMFWKDIIDNDIDPKLRFD